MPLYVVKRLTAGLDEVVADEADDRRLIGAAEELDRPLRRLGE